MSLCMASLSVPVIPSSAYDSSVIWADLAWTWSATDPSLSFVIDSTDSPVPFVTCHCQQCDFMQCACVQSRKHPIINATHLLQAHTVPPMQRDDRLDLSASGKSRSDPARSRALRAGTGRGRGRHSIDLGHDLKRAMAQQTIHEDVRNLSLLTASACTCPVPLFRSLYSGEE